MVWQLIVIAIVAYLIGSVNLSIILCKAMGKGDIRKQGSGNAGTTNTLRTLGKGPALLVFLFDILKAVVAIWIGKLLIRIGLQENINFALYQDWAMVVASVSVILGHNFPIYYGFKGGKGIATSLGVLLTIEWQLGLVCLLFGIILILLTRMVSVGSIASAILYPVLVLIQGNAFSNKWIYLGFSLVLAVMALIRHRSNIKRIIAGTENKLWKTKAEKKAELK